MPTYDSTEGLAPAPPNVLTPAPVSAPVAQQQAAPLAQPQVYPAASALPMAQYTVQSRHPPPAAAPSEEERAEEENVLPRDVFNSRSLGPAFKAVRKARVLMVGAGGIGCELLKNLALTGFGEIHAVDLDTIDLSNLNRQFLFRHEHIKRPKAEIAKEAAQKFNRNVTIIPHSDDIKKPEFNVDWFRSFGVVFNALDNFDARRHVNKMCLAAGVPLIDSGTTGFNGQVQVIKQGVTACYDCAPKDPPKSFPVCTIRSTPSQPIHCIVWGKSYLLNEIFGTSEDQSVIDHSADQDNANEVEELKREAEALRKIREAVGSEPFAQMLFDKVFKTDVERLRSMEDMWKGRKPPSPLEFAVLKKKSSDALGRTEAILKDGQKTWNLEENFAVFVDSLDRLSKRVVDQKAAESPSGPKPTIEFDKDDEDTLDFVTASANIRSAVFGIEPKSRFDIKQMAGNIIPAIATTNAIVAGLCVLEAFKVLQGDYETAKEAFLTPFNPDRRIAPSRPRSPNPDCPVCSAFYTSVSADLERATLEDLVEGFIKPELGFDGREFSVNIELGCLYEVDDTENLPKKLSEFEIKSGTFITIIDDDDEEPLVNVVINIQDVATGDGEKPVQGLWLDKKPEIPRKPKKAPEPETNGVTMSNGAPKQVVVETLPPPQGTKRPHEDDVDSREPKKVKTGGDEIVIDDTPDKATATGIIVLD
ncbi:SUMO-activating enzyme subunit uba-2 [Magnaporthiopsis poae ATCC 64411]|uniref:SUMO-activating enzyme subunit uba-2 n=1 Tax=Magnaporthiopsis poae (strain ATCC 64411 / 73-15) TaxID=644358 RepID=A0A0C4DK55_MAGP6|nr:SUMO-activating enzyme subunit uba-2 [Magnaporthiopsis poae ATCC 64411]